MLSGVARQPGARATLVSNSLVHLALVEAAYFSNPAFAALMIFAPAGDRDPDGGARTVGPWPI